jgi:hypothetical protein
MRGAVADRDPMTSGVGSVPGDVGLVLILIKIVDAV